METLSSSNASLCSPPTAPKPPRTAHAATVVTVVYVLLALGAPWIVRYAPASESGVAAQIAERPALLRCASAPEFGMPCGSQIPDVRAVSAHG